MENSRDQPLDTSIAQLVTTIGVVVGLVVAYGKAFASYQEQISQAIIPVFISVSRQKGCWFPLYLKRRSRSLNTARPFDGACAHDVGPIATMGWICPSCRPELPARPEGAGIGGGLRLGPRPRDTGPPQGGCSRQYEADVEGTQSRGERNTSVKDPHLTIPWVCRDSILTVPGGIWTVPRGHQDHESVPPSHG